MNSFLKRQRIFLIMIPCLVFLAVIYVKFIKLSSGKKSTFIIPQVTVERGLIVDRNEKPLAISTTFYHFSVTPKLIKNPSHFSKLVAPILQMNEEEIEKKISENKSLSFLYLKKKISQEQFEDLSRIISQNDYYNACKFDTIPGRIYPENNLASQLIGYMGDEGRGLSGIEYSQQDVLSPQIKPNQTGAFFGNNVYLTIDAGLQYKLEKIVQNAMEETKADNLRLIAANAKTGEILSYISLPSVNLNEYSSASAKEKIDRPAVLPYEPGSVFKIFSVAAFLNSRGISADDSFLCDGIYSRKTSRGEVVKITCLAHHGWLNARKALELSCNDALAQMSEKINTEDFLVYIHKFGFGERTGVELPSETPGFVRNTDDRFWSARSKATISIGQEIQVSALQLVQAATALANKGQIIKLSLIHKICDKDRNVIYEHKVVPGEKVLSASTADYILSCMETTTERGNATRAFIGDISIGSKTGTAQMAENGTYSKTDFLANEIAIFPVNNPQIILYIAIEKPQGGETYAGRIVAPVIKATANEIIDHLGIARENAASLAHSGRTRISSTQPVELKTKVPDFTGRSKRDLLPLLQRDDIRVIIKGEGWVTSQTPEAGTPVTGNMTIELNLE